MKIFQLLCLLILNIVMIGHASATDGIPSFESILYKHKQTRDLNNFLGALHTGRYESLKRTTQVVACPSPDATHCDPSGLWHKGWIMFVDTNGDTLRDDNEDLIWSEGEMTEGFTLSGSGEISSYFRFSPEGYMLDNGTFTFCDPRGKREARAIIVSSDKRPHTSFADAHGDALTCP